MKTQGKKKSKRFENSKNLREFRANIVFKEMAMWVFGYGSIMWKAGFHYDERVVGFIKDYRRVFYQGFDMYLLFFLSVLNLCDSFVTNWRALMCRNNLSGFFFLHGIVFSGERSKELRTKNLCCFCLDIKLCTKKTSS